MKYKYKPKTKEELLKAIKKEIYEIQGTPDNPNWEADLNCIDTSEITDMSYLFSAELELEKFNGNISNWDVSNVNNMTATFLSSKFNQDISNWNVSNAESMVWMFAESEFNQDISNWNVSKVNFMTWMFARSEFNQDISNWNVNNVYDMSNMFEYSKFNKDIGKWNNKEETKLENISVSDEYPKLPDEIKYPETIANIFNYVFKNPNSKKITKNQAIDILAKWFKNKKNLYIKKNYNKKIINKFLTNDVANILKNVENQDELLNIINKIVNKKEKENNKKDKEIEDRSI